ncbi:transcriptional regulator [Porphyromonas crevioricanis]|uniref:Regulatory protein AsnC n=2 Tax=Porphyromonas crevioricanis TaxID=393921 RepID=A0A0A2FYS8_9PORP|nr:Lrp/AsnC ligand binding domain-containing protein [Porphyromonas crevioricanis]KGN90328.1 transcriptional regulator [Porphyromonas crevioricanis]KGN95332.1 transcriptional regulator [Porphyromonas crevioricanis]SJZ59962.1 Lrp/AsnC family transcriptional regulator, regulator for asnA, asnC and gidA [Porphyromonas crevioricanis]SQH72768.1 Regulatory protein AsnC [Porphyromonas crevioricanis]GAD05640.1 transcriptional regulator, AsnC family [Porphyromonas crevioricanis JCM 15906]
MIKLDSLDRRILSIISENARTPFKDVAEQCGVSRAAIHQRVLRLQEQGVIIGSGYHVNPKTLGYSTCTYVGVKLERASLYKEVVPKLYSIPEVIECHYTTGPYSVLIKLYAKDNNHLMRILNATIQEIPGIIATETLISLDLAFVRNIPIPQEEL